MYRITLQSSTAFFKNDMTITSIQQTYDCPPLSTIYGLISAAVGEKVEPISVGYIFDYKYKTEDYELIIKQLEKSNKQTYMELAKAGRITSRHDVLQGCFGTIPIKREIMVKCKLYLYVEDESIAEAFKMPYYTLLLGRSEDLAFVKEVKKVELKEDCHNITVGKTIIPFQPKLEVFGRLCSMPVYITDEYPRKVTKARVFMILQNDHQKIRNHNNMFLYDEELKKGVYIHKEK
jgi:CRISPR-associated protein Cas5t